MKWYFVSFIAILLLPAISLHGEDRLTGAGLKLLAEESENSNKPDSAIYYYTLSAGQFLAEGDFNSQAGIYNTLGNIYLNMRNYPEAVDYFIRSAEIYEQRTENKKALSRPLINIAVIQNALGNTELALEYAQKGLNIARQFKEESVMVFTQRLIGGIYRKMGRFDEAIREIRNTLPYYYQEEDWANLSASYCQIANNLFDKGNLSQALMNVDSAITLAKKAGHRSHLAHALHSSGFILHGLRQLDQAKAHIDSSIMIAREISDPYLILDGYRKNADIEKERNNLDGYARYMSLYIAKRDSIDEVMQRAQVEELEARYQNKDKQGEIDVLLLEQQLLASNIRRQKIMRNLISSILLIVVIFSIALINRFRLLNTTRRQLEVEKLRNSIARDLHDDLGSTLSSINILSQMAFLNQHADTRSVFGKISTHSALMMDKLHDIVWSIHPDNDNMEQLIARMREFSAEILEPKAITARFLIKKEVCSLRPDLEKRKTIYMIFKEAVNNAAKYSNASQVIIQFELSGNSFALRIKDNGNGFHIEDIKKGNGLRNMQDRAKLSGGSVSVSSQPGQGTEVVLDIAIT